MQYLNKTLVGLIFFSVFIISLFFPAESPYSINKNVESLGETRNISQLLFSTNRLELKDKLEITIFNSEIRNNILDKIAKLTWEIQKTSNTFDYQFFNTEIFYGKKGEVFPKYTNCEKYFYDNLNIEAINGTEYIFLLMPLKQEIENDKLHRLQRDYSLCDNIQNFVNFKNQYMNNKTHILNIYNIFSDETNRYYEFGDTHWNDFGVKQVFSKILEITHGENAVSVSKGNNRIKENNLILKRLGLIDEEFYQNEYKINFETSNIKSLLIIHDSFFEESYVKNSFLKQYYQAELKTWSYLRGLSKVEAYKIINKYDYVIFESSIDSFFEDRILYFSE